MAVSLPAFKIGCLNLSATFASRLLKGRSFGLLYMSTTNNIISRSTTRQHCRKMSTSGTKALDLSGIYPPITTPFDKEEKISYEQMENNIKRWSDFPFKGYVVQGSNGEYVYLSKEERVEVVKRVREMAPKDKLIFAGSGCESTGATIEMGNLMAAAGADAVLVVTPCYYKASMTADALFHYYTKVADASPVPVILYSVPMNTGVDLSAETAIKLSSHPNIIGMKSSGGDVTKIGSMVHKTKGNNFQVLAGSASFLMPAYSVGAVGGVCALANVLGKECCELHDLYHTGKYEEAKALQHRLIAPNAAVTSKFGVPALKHAMEWFGFYGGPVRSPLLPLTTQQVEAVRNSFADNGFL